jgi:hypothetical protein
MGEASVRTQAIGFLSSTILDHLSSLGQSGQNDIGNLHELAPRTVVPAVAILRVAHARDAQALIGCARFQALATADIVLNSTRR